MALIKSCLAAGGAGDSIIFAGKLAAYFGSSTNTGITNASLQLSAGESAVFFVIKGQYNSLTVSGSRDAAYGLKADGTKETITATNNVFDLTNYIGAVLNFSTVTSSTTVSATLS